MRICIVLHSLKAGGGVQERRAMLLRHWHELGFRITVVCPTRTETDLEAFAKFAEIIYLNLSPKRGRYLLLSCIVPLRRLLRKRKFDIILASNVVMITSVSLALIGKKEKLALFGTVHNPIWINVNWSERVKSVVNIILINIASLNINGIAGNSSAVSAEVERFLLRKVPMRTIYNPVIELDASTTYIRLNRSRAPGQRVIIAVGRLSYQKGFDILIRAIKELEGDVVVKIVGDGPLRNELRELARQENVEERVLFLGYRSDVIELMGEADCFVLSSRWEGFGNVLVEALYAQIPIVSFDCRYGPREILAGGRYGILVGGFDPQTLASGLKHALLCGQNKNTRWKDFQVAVIAKDYQDFLRS